jgi:CubicO group peptidase (beta-lactamase class C family)
MYIAEKEADHVLLKRPPHPLLVRHLLTHTGGLLYQSPLETPTLDGLTLRDAVRTHAMLPLQFAPGSKSLYSSAGINTAARIIEVRSGMPFDKFMAQRLFLPLGMKDTTFVPNAEQVKRVAKLYTSNAAKTGLMETTAKRFTYPLDNPQRQPIPGSGLFSTAVDVARFCQMILHGGVFGGKRYLSAAAVQQMTSRQTPPDFKSNYGFGWERYKDGGFGHGGSFKTYMSIDPQHAVIAVLLMQEDYEFPHAEGKQIFLHLRAAALEVQRPR